MAQVFKVRERTTGGTFALKKIPLKGKASLERAVDREITILRKLRHHHITALHDVLRSPQTVYAVLEVKPPIEPTDRAPDLILPRTLHPRL